MDNFANIGKAILIQSLGIQKNYVEIVESTVDVTDYSNSSCSDCKYKAVIDSFAEGSEPYIAASNVCAGCPNRLITQKNVIKKIYHNDKNRYGYRPMLKNNAIKLLLLLHFNHPDKHGIIKNVNAHELAKVLNCNVKTIWNNLETLKEYTYIEYSKINSKNFSVMLTDYENYYLPANKNGRGFIVMSRDLLLKLINITSLVALRIYLRELINLDDPALKGQASVDHKKIEDIRSTLPSYCKPCIIKDNINKPNEIFYVSIKDNIIRFEIDKNFIPRYQKELIHEEYESYLREFIGELNINVCRMNANENYSDKFIQFFDIQNYNSSYKPVSLSDIEIDDLASLAVHYSLDNVIEALAKIYVEYFLIEKPVRNLGGLASTIIRSQLNTKFEAA